MNNFIFDPLFSTCCNLAILMSKKMAQSQLAWSLQSMREANIYEEVTQTHGKAQL